MFAGSLGNLLLLVGILFAANWFLATLRVRELALQAARRACLEQGVQLLDQTVSGRRLSLSRDHQGRWRVWRLYQFEYTEDGNERQFGEVIMLGRQMQALIMAEQQPTLH